MDRDLDTADLSAKRGDLASKLVLGVVLVVTLSVVVGSWLATRPAAEPAKPGARRIEWIGIPQVALAEAQGKGKPLLVRFVAQWCGVCTRMERDTFPNADVIAAVNERFVPLSVDVTSPNGPNSPFAARYEIEYLPTLLVLTPDGREIARSSGLMQPHELVQWLAEALAPGPRHSVGGVTG